MDDRIIRLIFQVIDQTISEQDFEWLQDAMEQDAAVRREYLRAINLCESLSEIASGASHADSQSESLSGGSLGIGVTDGAHPDSAGQPNSTAVESPQWSWQFLAVAASLLILVGVTAFQFGRVGDTGRPGGTTTEAESVSADVEPLIAGHATLRRSVDLQWNADSSAYRDGDVLPNGLLRFDHGIAEIDFFCGATLIVEGPAILDVQSDWVVRVVRGRLRASVPPAARGFIVKAAESEIVDLGTEFAVEVDHDNARLEVIDGEVELRGGEHDGNHLVTGQRQWLKGSVSRPEAFEGLSTIKDLQRRREDAQAKQFDRWKSLSRALRNDDRLIAYYPIAESKVDRFIPNAALSGDQHDGTFIGSVSVADGRFGPESCGLEFDRPGSRVRVRIDGEFAAFTFSCWARIDSLDHQYNALFMGDGYENGEPHWQIHEDGRMMFSVMVDDTPGAGGGPAKDSRLHHLYFTPPIWDVSKSGQWLHLVAVFDPNARRVTQFVNGEVVSEEPIMERFFVDRLRIGAAEIGNWGQPLRESPWFAVRNLNGAIDELAIFNTALQAEEIRTLYEQGKPLGY